MDPLGNVPVVGGEGGYLLRPWDAITDLGTVMEAGTDSHIPSITSVPRHGGSDDAVAFIERQHQHLTNGVGSSFAIAAKGGGPAVGHIGVWTAELQERGRVTLGYWVTPSKRRRGVAAAAVQLATEWAQSELRPVRCQLHVEPWNEGSWRAAEHAGYEREGLLSAWQQIDGVWRDLFVYAKVQRE